MPKVDKKKERGGRDATPYRHAGVQLQHSLGQHLLKNPLVTAAMIEKAGGKMTGLWLTRGEYDAVVIGEAPDFETVAAIKMMVLASGAMNEMVILEAADFNAIGERAAAMMAGAGAYRAPGS